MTWAPTTPEVDAGGGAGGWPASSWPQPEEPPRPPRQNWRLAFVIVALVAAGVLLASGGLVSIARR